MHSILFSLVAVLGLLSAVSDDTDDKKNPNSIDWPAILAPERPLATSKKPKPSSPPATPPKFVWPKGLDGKPLYDPNLFETDPDLLKPIKDAKKNEKPSGLPSTTPNPLWEQYLKGKDGKPLYNPNVFATDPDFSKLIEDLKKNKPKPSSPLSTPPKFVWPKGLDGKPLYDPNLFETDPDLLKPIKDAKKNEKPSGLPSTTPNPLWEQYLKGKDGKPLYNPNVFATDPDFSKLIEDLKKNKPKPSSPLSTPPKFVWPKGLDGKPLYDPNLFETDPDIFIRDRIAKSTRFTEDSSESVWSDFRRKFPYLIQGIAIRRGSGQDCVVIVADLPPTVQDDDLRSLLPTFELKKHQIGADGWVTDAVARLQISDGKLQELIGDLHRLLFDTAYKAYAIDLRSDRPTAPSASDLDLRVRPVDLMAWLVPSSDSTPPVRFRPINGGKLVPFADLAASTSAVLQSDPPGLVGWWLPTGVAVSDCAVSARQFAVDSDFVIGGIGDERGTLILGRERLLPLELMPPLRFETICLLSSIRKPELMQTINPQLLSCFINNDPRERWELNILSPELANTEFGALLTITDVLLKSWSMNGLNSVRGFRSYRIPRDWPFTEPLPSLLNATSIVFNYNSEAAGCHIALEGTRALFSVTRTGVLPIAYFPGDKISDRDKTDKVFEAERSAYEWFARQGDPNLIRVVQYTALLQAFQAFEVHSPAKAARAKDVVVSTYKTLVHELCDSVANADDAKLTGIHKRMKECAELAYCGDVLSKRAGGAEKTKAIRDQVTSEANDVVADLRKLSSTARTRLAATLTSDGRSFKDEREKFLGLLPFRLVASAERLDQLLAERLSQGTASRLKSPVLIYDKNDGAIAFGEGGHNLKTKTPRLVVDATAKEGEVPLRDSEGRFRVNPRDLGKMTIRGRSAPPILEVDTPPQSMPVALKQEPSKLVRPSRQYGWWCSSDSLSPFEQAIVDKVRAARESSVCVFQRGDGTFVIDNGRAIFEARTHQEAIDAVIDTTADKNLKVEFTGFTADQADAFGTTLLARRKGKERVIEASVSRGAADERLPIDFRPQEYNLDGLDVLSFHVSETDLKAELSVPAKAAGDPALKVNIFVRAGKRTMAALKGVKELFTEIVRSVLSNAASHRDFHDQFAEKVRARLRAAFPDAGTDFSDLDVQTQVRFRFHDQYMSESPTEKNAGRDRT